MQRFECSACGAAQVFDPASGKLRCTGCAQEQAIAAAGGAGLPAHDLLEALRSAAGAVARPVSATALQVTCSGCGASVTFEPPLVAGQCPFCAAKIVTQPKAADPLIAPGAVLPFALNQAQANQRIRDWISSLWFAPGSLRQLALVKGLSGVYVPFWSFDALTLSVYEGERGDAYRETVARRSSDGRVIQEQVQRIRWSRCRGEVSVPFSHLLVPASTSVQRIQLADLDPWDVERLVPYEPAYLAGFQAQRYQVPLEQGFDLAKSLMEPSITAAVRAGIGGDSQRIHSLSTRYRDVDFRHVLLPVWIGAYHFQGRVFQLLVNARTGEVQGDRPYSAGKIALAVLVALVIFAVLARWFG